MTDIVERLIVLRDIYRNTLSREHLDLLADAANEITSLRKQWLEGVTRILAQVQENASIVKDANARLDAIERR